MCAHRHIEGETCDKDQNHCLLDTEALGFYLYVPSFYFSIVIIVWSFGSFFSPIFNFINQIICITSGGNW